MSIQVLTLLATGMPPIYIFANLMRLITSPDDRVLVIYGQGHVQLLRSFIKGSPDLQFIDPLTVLK